MIYVSYKSALYAQTLYCAAQTHQQSSTTIIMVQMVVAESFLSHVSKIY